MFKLFERRGAVMMTGVFCIGFIHMTYAQQTPASGASTDEEDGLKEIVVTATGQAQSLSKTPQSVLALDQSQMDERGIKSFADLVQYAPGVNITQDGVGEVNLSIRGLSSTAGAATTGVYIDNTPIQVRNIGYSAGNVYPTIFDLDRVEILRGPQGTLFGSGSEGGTLRFIQTEPNLTGESGYARAEGATIENGGQSYEAGAAFGAPIIPGLLGFRVSAFFRRDGGWVDTVKGSSSVADPTGAAGPESVAFAGTGIAERDANYQNTTALRLALKAEPSEGLSITPSINYQDNFHNESVSTFWPEISNYKTGNFETPIFIPTVDASHLPISSPLNQPLSERFLLPSVNVDWKFGSLELTSSTAYFKRDMHSVLNAAELYDLIYGGFRVPQPGNLSTLNYVNTQRNYSQEFRLQPASTGERLYWVAGIFVQRANQLAEERVLSNFISLLPRVFGGTTNGSPFGTGSSAYVNWYGEDPLDNGVETWHGRFYSVDKQYAAYGQAEYSFTSELKATVGLRVAKVENDFDAEYSGPENNLNAPHGAPCTDAAGCVAGQGAYAIAYPSSRSTTKDTSVTPKFLLSYQLDSNNLFYASATKGFRPGGGEAGLAAACDAGLAKEGYPNGSPGGYKSDSVWSYELGTKNNLLEHRLRVAASGYYLKWSDIQSSVFVNSCFQSFVSNLGSATGKGFDLDVQYRLLDSTLLGSTVAYNKTTFDEAVAPSGAIVYSKGSAVPGSGAPWHVTLFGQYELSLTSDMKGYVRADEIYTSAQKPYGATDPASVNYDPLEAPVPTTHMLNLRTGVRFSSVDLSFFVNNATNSFPNLGLSRTAGTIVWTDFSFQPRTFGVTAAAHF